MLHTSHQVQHGLAIPAPRVAHCIQALLTSTSVPKLIPKELCSLCHLRMQVIASTSSQSLKMLIYLYKLLV